MDVDKSYLATNSIICLVAVSYINSFICWVSIIENGGSACDNSLEINYLHYQYDI